MLYSLTFLVEKLSLLSNFKLFEFKWTDGKRKEAGCTERTTYSHTVAPLSLQRGDLLEVPRTLFTHFGIYLGDNNVAHLIPDIMPVLTNDKMIIKTVITNKRLIMGCLYKCATVRVDTLDDFVYGSNILVNHMDRKCKAQQPFPNEEVAERAERLVGAIPYSLLWNNCEHFVTYCRYGSAKSQQTEMFCECLKSIIRDQRSVFLSVLLGIIYIICFGLAPSTTLPTILIPFTLWMAG
ncbi:lecithin retinol acyltransferase-like [Salvelinus fontinalis]|uniref:lecithin retinol acyltransferase-like n=1 Tax=Salvelinus fontinalis TaxID=8038 RepID=UPI002486594D|nr:lecithin retinol acyltransferase-like [Salvelinus fontinalis]